MYLSFKNLIANKDKYSYKEDLISTATIYNINQNNSKKVLQKQSVPQTNVSTPRLTPNLIDFSFHKKNGTIALNCNELNIFNERQKCETALLDMSKLTLTKLEGKDVTRNNLQSEDDGTAEHSFGAPDIKSIINYNSTHDYKILDKEKALKKFDLPKDYQKRLHELRIHNAELRNELAEKSRAKVKAEKLWTERARYKDQMKKILETKAKLAEKQKNELLKRQEENSSIKESIKGNLRNSNRTKQ